MFRPGSTEDRLADDLALQFARANGVDYREGHHFRLTVIDEAFYRANAELAIVWALQPQVFKELGRVK